MAGVMMAGSHFAVKVIALGLLYLIFQNMSDGNTPISGFHRSPFFDEQVCEEKLPCGVRMLINEPVEMHSNRPTLVIFYARPNGNTIEQTMGCAMVPDLDWHFDIQHIAAQTRRLREIDKSRNIVLVCVEAEGLSWPSWRQKRPDNGRIIREMIESTVKRLSPDGADVVLTGHSGGGSMITGFINGGDTIPNYVTRIAYLDANYSYDDEQGHGDKLIAWLRKSAANHLVVIAYDDREITLDGKKVLGPTGGTFRATHRMLNRFENDIEFRRSQQGEFDIYEGSLPITRDSSRNSPHVSVTTYNQPPTAVFIVHRNPKNRILHTALVGEMNGYMHAMTLGTSLEGEWGRFGGRRAYTKWVQPAAVSVDSIPPRPKHADGGHRVMARVADLPLGEREKVIFEEIQSGNLPTFLRKWKTIRVRGKDANGRERTVCFYTMPDYLSVGSDGDFVRVCITPMTAQAIADAFSCSLPTRKMVNDIYEQAEVKLEPRPLTEKREAVETFVQHNSIIEEQRKGSPLGRLLTGAKKDVVITNLPSDRQDHVAIYGWHKLDGTPIQPLTTVHVNWYVDYSHGVRLIKRTVLVDGNPRDIRDILSDPVMHPLLSDEGPIAQPYYAPGVHGPRR